MINWGIVGYGRMGKTFENCFKDPSQDFKLSAIASKSNSNQNKKIKIFQQYDDLINLSELEISFEVMKQFVGKEINSNKLIEILEDTISFDFPLIKLSKNIYTLELFHGPTMAFKDDGARFMSRCINYFINNYK